MERGQPKSRIGVIKSNKMQKTVVVEVQRRVRHAKYGKFLTKRMKYKAHDEENVCQVGDTVRIVETRPMSKDKRWRVAETLEKAREA
jgi:small subunit ribosomal protein S17